MRDDFAPTTAPSGPQLAPGPAFVLLAALIVGFLRLWSLGEWSIWIDEAFTVADWGVALERGDFWNPVGYMGIRAMVGLLGGETSAWNLRILPAMGGWLCVPLAYWAFSSTFGRRRAAWVALLLALSSWHIFWSQTARFYTFAMALSLVGSGLALRGLWGGNAPRAILGLATAAAAAAFHPTAALVVPALALAPIAVRGRGASPGGGFGATARVLLVLAAVGGVVPAHWLWTSILNHVQEKATADLLAGPVHLILTCGYFFTPVVGVAALLGGFWSWHTRNAPGLFAASVCVIGLAVVLLISTFALMTAQYAFCLLPWALILALAPLDALAEASRRRGLAVLLCGGLTVSAALSTLFYLTIREGERPRWREAYEFIDRERQAGDLVLGMGSQIGEIYLGGRTVEPRSPRVTSPLARWFPKGPLRWNRFPRRIWVVIRSQWLAELSEQDRVVLETWLADECRVVQRLPVDMQGRDLEVLVYLREP
jgi:hypothetical protein